MLKKKRYIIFMLLILVPFLFFIGESTWVVLNVRNEVIDNNFLDINVEEYQTVTYDGTEKEIFLNTDGLLIDKDNKIIKTYIPTNEDDELSPNGLPIKAGSYTVMVEYQTSESRVVISEVDFEIDPVVVDMKYVFTDYLGNQITTTNANEIERYYNANEFIPAVEITNIKTQTYIYDEETYSSKDDVRIDISKVTGDDYINYGMPQVKLTIAGNDASNYTFNGNYGEQTLTSDLYYEINKRPVEIVWDFENGYHFTYGDETPYLQVKELKNLVSGEVRTAKVEYYVYESQKGYTKITGDYPKAAGSYMAEVTAIMNGDAEDTNYIPDEETATIFFEIDKREIFVEWGDLTFVYNGQGQAPIATIVDELTEKTGVLDGDSCDINYTYIDESGVSLGDTKPINANHDGKTYSVVAYTTNQNYVLNAEKEKYFTITRAKANLYPNANEVTYGDEIENHNGYSIYLVINGEEQENAGLYESYEAIFGSTSVVSAENYAYYYKNSGSISYLPGCDVDITYYIFINNEPLEFANNIQNYDLTYCEGKLTVNQRPIYVTEWDADGGNEHKHKVNDKEYDGYTYEFTGAFFAPKPIKWTDDSIFAADVNKIEIVSPKTICDANAKLNNPDERIKDIYTAKAVVQNVGKNDKAKNYYIIETSDKEGVTVQPDRYFTITQCPLRVELPNNNANRRALNKVNTGYTYEYMYNGYIQLPTANIVADDVKMLEDLGLELPIVVVKAYVKSTYVENEENEAVDSKNVGEYIVETSEFDSTNFAVKEVQVASMTITPAPLYIYAQSYEYVYGDKLPYEVNIQPEAEEYNPAYGTIIYNGQIDSDGNEVKTEGFLGEDTFATVFTNSIAYSYVYNGLDVSHEILNVLWNGNSVIAYDGIIQIEYNFEFVDGIANYEVHTFAGNIEVTQREVRTTFTDPLNAKITEGLVLEEGEQAYSYVYNGLIQKPDVTLHNVLDKDKLFINPVLSGYGKNANLDYNNPYTLSVDALSSSDGERILYKNYILVSDEDYKLTQDYLITRAPLNVYASNGEIIYGSLPNNGGVVFEGFVNNELPSDVFNGTWTLTNGSYFTNANIFGYIYGNKDVSSTYLDVLWNGSNIISYVDLIQLKLGGFEFKNSIENYDVIITEESSADLKVLQREITFDLVNEKEYTYNAEEQKPIVTITNVHGDDKIVLVTKVLLNNSAVAPIDAANGYAFYIYDIADSDDAIVSKYKNYKLPKNQATIAYTFDINPKPITMTWGTLSTTYNSTNLIPVNTINGTYTRDNIDYNILYNGSIITTIKDAGTYALSVEFTGTTSNYVLPTNTTATLVIKPAPIIISWEEPADYIYTSSNIAPKANYVSGLIGTDTTTVVTTIYLNGAEVTVYKDVDSYVAKASSLNKNYIVSNDVTLSYSILKREMILTPNSYSHLIYGDADTISYGYTQTGLQTNDTLLSIIPNIDIVEEYDQYDNAGKYTISITPNLSHKNYYFTYKTGTLTVNPKPLDIYFTDPNTDTKTFSYVYNGLSQHPDVHFNGIVIKPSGMTQDIVNPILTGNNYKNANTTLNPKYTLKVTGLSNSNYIISSSTITTQDFVITPAPLSIVALNQEIIYGDEVILDQSKYTITGLVADDSAIVALSTPYAMNQDRGNGSFAIKVTVSGNNINVNYEIHITEGVLTVKKRDVTAVFEDVNSFVYNGNVQYPRVTFIDKTNVIFTEDFMSATVEGKGVDVASYTLVVSAVNNNNYNLANVARKDYSITPATVDLSWTIAGNYATDGSLKVVYNRLNQKAEPRIITPLFGNDELFVSSIVLKVDTLEQLLNYANIGDYLAKASLSGAAAHNYQIATTCETQGYSITKKPLTIYADYTIQYGDDLSIEHLKENAIFYYDGLIDGDIIDLSAINIDVIGYEKTLIPGTYSHQNGTVYVVMDNAINDNYLISYDYGTLTISVREVAITYSNTELTYTASLQGPTINLNLVNGDTVSINEVQNLSAINAGAYTLKITSFKGEDAAYYHFINLSCDYVIARADLSVVINNHTITYGAYPTSAGMVFTGLLGSDTPVTVFEGSWRLSQSAWYSDKITYGSYATTILDVATYNDLIGVDLVFKTIDNVLVQNYEITSTNNGDLTVEEKEVTISFTDPNALTTNFSYVYNGNSQNPSATIVGLIDQDIDVVTLASIVSGINVTDGNSINVGDYTYTVSLTSNNGKHNNYVIVVDGNEVSNTSCDYEITQAPLEVSWGVITGLIYNKENRIPTISLSVNYNNELSLNLITYDANDNVVNTAINAGDYALRLEISGPIFNYNLVGSNIENNKFVLTNEFTIFQKEVNIIWDLANVIENTNKVYYNSLHQAPTAMINPADLIAGDDCRLDRSIYLASDTNSALKTYVDVNNYVAKVVLTGNDANNYKIALGKDTFDYSIVKCEVEAVVFDETITYGDELYTNHIIKYYVNGNKDNALDKVYGFSFVTNVYCTETNSDTPIASNAILPAGEYRIVVEIEDFENFNFTTTNGILTVEKKELEVIVQNQTITYGNEATGARIAVSGYVNGETFDVFEGLLTLAPEANNLLVANNNLYVYNDLPENGIYNVLYRNGVIVAYENIIGLDIDEINKILDNYFIIGEKVQTADLTVNRRPLAITYENAEAFSYNGSDHEFEYNVEDNVLSIDRTLLIYNETITYNGNLAQNTKDAGKYSLTITLSSTDNKAHLNYELTAYDYTPVQPGVYTINRAELTVTINNAEITYGEYPIDAGITFAGLVGEETPSDIFAGKWNESANTSGLWYVDQMTYLLGENSVASKILDADTYEDLIGVNLVFNQPINYNIINIEKGDLEVSKKTVNIEWTLEGNLGNNTVSFNNKDQAPQAKILTELVPNDICNPVVTIYKACVLDEALTEYKAIGDYVAKVTLTGASANNYEIAYGEDEYAYSIIDCEVRVVISDETIIYGENLPTNHVINYYLNGDTETPLDNVFGFKFNIDLYYTEVDSNTPIESNAILPVGKYTIVVNITDYDNLSFTFETGTLTVNKKDLTILINDQTVTYGHIAAGAGLTITGFVNGDTYDKVFGTLFTLNESYLIDNSLDVINTLIYTNGTTNVTNTILNVLYDSNGSVVAYENMINVNIEILNGTETASNYNIKEENVTKADFMVNRKELTVTVSNQDIIYGDLAQGASITITGYENNEDYTVFGDLFTSSNGRLIDNTSDSKDTVIYVMDNGDNVTNTVLDVLFNANNEIIGYEGIITVNIEVLNKALKNYIIIADKVTNNDLTVEQRKVTVSFTDPNASTITPGKAGFSYVYNGLEQKPNITINNLISADDNIITPVSTLSGDNLTSGKSINVGAYTGTVTALTSTNNKHLNYLLVTDDNHPTSIDYSITQKEVEVVFAAGENGSYDSQSEKYNYTYSGGVQHPTASFNTSKGLVSLDSTYVKLAYSTVLVDGEISETNDSIDANTGDTYYTVTVSLADVNGSTQHENYKLVNTVSANYIINPYGLDVAWSNTSLTYNGEAQKPTLTINDKTYNSDVVTVNGLSFYDSDNNLVATASFDGTIWNFSDSAIIRNQGTYKVIVTSVNDSNYMIKATSATLESFVILQRKLVLTWSTENSWTYDANAHSVTVTGAGTATEGNAIGLVGEDTIASIITITNNSQTNAGDYTAKAEISETGNYYLEDSKGATVYSETYEYSIAKRGIVLTWTYDSGTTFTYGDSFVINVDNVTNLATGETIADAKITVSGHDSKNANAYTNTEKYTAIATVSTDSNYFINSGASCDYIINQRVLEISWTVSSGLKTADNVLCFKFNKDQVGKTPLLSPTHSFTNIVDGDKVNSQSAHSNQQNYFGVYTATISSVDNANYVLPTNKSTSFVIASAYTTSDSDTKYYTWLIDALKAAQSSNAAEIIWVIPGANQSINESVTINSGDKLALTYDETILNHTATTTSPTHLSNGPNRFADSTPELVAANKITEITISGTSPVKLTITGELYIGAELGTNINRALASHTSGRYCQITMGSNSNIESSGTIRCYGYIKEQTKTSAMDGAIRLECTSGILYTPYVLYDFRGASHVGGSIFNQSGIKKSPFNDYDTPNIQILTKINSAAKMIGVADLYTNAQSIAGYDIEARHNVAEVQLLGNSGCLINIASGGYALIKYTPANAGLTEQVTSGTNTQLALYGGGSFGYITLSVTVAFKTITINTKDIYFAIPYRYSISLNDGEYSMDYVLKLMTGATLRVEDDATFKVAGKFIIYDSFTDIVVTDSIYPQKEQAQFIVNGSVIVTGGLAGLIQTENSSARIQFSDTAKTTLTSYEGSAKMSDSDLDKAAALTDNYNKVFIYQPIDEITVSANGEMYNNNCELGNFVFSNTYFSKEGAWYNSTISITYVNTATGVSSVEKVTLSNPGERFNVTKTLNQTGYTFLGWTTDVAGTIDYDEAYPDGIINSITLYSKLEAQSFTVHYEYNFIDCEAPADTSNLPTSATYFTNTGITFPTTTITGYKFIAWYSDTAMTKLITGINPNEPQNITVYGKYVDANVEVYTITFTDSTGTIASSTATVIGTSSEIATFLSSFTANYETPHINSYNNNDMQMKYFKGWYDLNGTKFTSNSNITGNVTLTAIWGTKATLTYQFDKSRMNTSTYFVEESSKTIKVIPSDNGIYTLSTDISAKTGYYLIGWVDSSGNVVTSVSVSDGANISVSAVIRKIVTVNLTASGGLRPKTASIEFDSTSWYNKSSSTGTFTKGPSSVSTSGWLFGTRSTTCYLLEGSVITSVSGSISGATQSGSQWIVGTQDITVSA